MRPRELLIGLTLLVPTLVIGFWPRVAIDFYEASTNALSTQLLQGVAVAAGRFTPFA
jgi:NAD(P)H-quinone oxidoreductase subunit 4